MPMRPRGRKSSRAAVTFGHRSHTLCWEIDGKPLAAVFIRLIALDNDLGHVDEGEGTRNEEMRRSDREHASAWALPQLGWQWRSNRVFN